MGDLELQRLKAVADAVPAVLDLLFAENHGHDGRVIELSVAFDILKGRNISDEDIECEYDDGRRPTWWGFPGLDVSSEHEVKRPIRIAPVKQGFVVDHDLAFTDAVDLAEWLLEWLGLEQDARRHSDEYDRALKVVGAALAYVEVVGRGLRGQGDVGATYDRLAEAVKKWQTSDREEVGEAAKYRRGLT